MKVPGLLLFPVLALSASLLLADDWPQWRGPHRDDVSKETGLLKAWPKEGPKLLWTYRDAGIGYSGMAVVGDRLYTMGAKNGKEFLYALDLKSQQELWAVEVGDQLDNGWGDGPRGTPTVDGSVVYAIGGKGRLVAVSTDGKKTLWSKEFVKDLKGGVPGWGYTESPLVDGKLVVATPGGKDGTVAAFDKLTGELVWRSKDMTDGAQYASLVVAEFGGVRQYVQMTGKHVFAVAADDGRLVWSVERNGPTAAIPTPVIGPDFVYATSGYGAGCNLYTITSEGGTLKATQPPYWDKDAVKAVQNHHGGVLLYEGHIYGHSDSQGWVCQDPKTGKILWKNGGVEKGSVTCAGGMLYCYSQKGAVGLVEATPAGYKEAGRFTIPEKTKLKRKSGEIWTHPTVSNGKLYLRDQDLIFCFDVSADK